MSLHTVVRCDHCNVDILIECFVRELGGSGVWKMVQLPMAANYRSHACTRGHTNEIDLAVTHNDMQFRPDHKTLAAGHDD